jgi:hypothetical protein
VLVFFPSIHCFYRVTGTPRSHPSSPTARHCHTHLLKSTCGKVHSFVATKTQLRRSTRNCRRSFPRALLRIGSSKHIAILATTQQLISYDCYCVVPCRPSSSAETQTQHSNENQNYSKTSQVRSNIQRLTTWYYRSLFLQEQRRSQRKFSQKFISHQLGSFHSSATRPPFLAISHLP